MPVNRRERELRPGRQRIRAGHEPVWLRGRQDVEERRGDELGSIPCVSFAFTCPSSALKTSTEVMKSPYVPSHSSFTTVSLAGPDGLTPAPVDAPTNSRANASTISPPARFAMPPLQNTTMTTPSSGSTWNQALFPTVVPPCQKRRWPSHSSRIQPRPHCGDSASASPRSAWTCAISSTDSGLSTFVPATPSPPRRKERPKSSRSSTLLLMMPAGPTERGSAVVGAGTQSFDPVSRVWPCWYRWLMICSGSVKNWCRSRRWLMRAWTEASQVRPSSSSMIRPSTTQPELQYDQPLPGLNSGSASFNSATYFSMQSSPRPVSVKTSPLMPDVCDSRCLIVILEPSSVVDSGVSGSSSEASVSSSSLPSSRSCMIIVAVMIFVTEPIWQSVSRVVSTPVRLFASPVLATKRCSRPVASSMRSTPATMPGTWCRLAVSPRNCSHRAVSKARVFRGFVIVDSCVLVRCAVLLPC